MDDLDELQESEFVTDTDDQDSLDEKIDSEQRLRNHQLWVSFQNAACCITQLYQDRSQPNMSWVPFQNAASNLTSLYRDCVESQKKFAKLGYQYGRRKRMRDLNKLLKKRRLNAKNSQQTDLLAERASSESSANQTNNISNNNNNNNNINSAANNACESMEKSSIYSNNMSSILAVNQLNLDCDETPSMSMQNQQQQIDEHEHQQQQERSNSSYSKQPMQQQLQQQQTMQPHLEQLQQEPNPHVILGNNEDHLKTFQQALSAQASIKTMKSGQIRRVCSNSPGANQNNRAIQEHTVEESRLLELNQFLSEEYHRHVGSRKRSSAQMGGNAIKRIRE